MIENVTLFYVVTALVAFLIGLAKGGFGGTAGALATPLMALVLPNEPVIGTLLPVLILADIFAVAFHWMRWNWRLILLLLPGAIVGVTVGTWFITSAPTQALRQALGIIVIIFVMYKLVEKRLLALIHYESHDWHGLVAGIVTGFSSALAHIGSPPISIYLLQQKVTPRVFIATSALFFAILNLIKVPYYIYARLFDLHRIWQIAWLAPLVPLGVWVGKTLASRINEKTFEIIIVVVLAAIGVLLLVT